MAIGKVLKLISVEAAGVEMATQVWMQCPDGEEAWLSGNQLSCRALKGAEDVDVVLVVGTPTAGTPRDVNDDDSEQPSIGPVSELEPPATANPLASKAHGVHRVEHSTLTAAQDGGGTQPPLAGYPATSTRALEPLLPVDAGVDQGVDLMAARTASYTAAVRTASGKALVALAAAGAEAIDCLPHEVLALAFCYLDARTLLVVVPMVCKRWREVCAGSMPPLTLDVSWAAPCPPWEWRDPGLSVALTDAGLAGMIGRFGSVRFVRLCHCTQLTIDGILCLAAPSCLALTMLSLSGCTQVTDAWLYRLSRFCPGLTCLVLRNCGLVTDQGVGWVAKGCPHLTRLCFDESASVVGDRFYAGLLTEVAENRAGPGQNRHTRSDDKLLSDWEDAHGYAPYEGYPGRPLAPPHPQATPPRVTDAGLWDIATGCPNLKWLDVSQCEEVTDVGLEQLAACCPNLNRVRLRFCPRVTDTGIEKLATGCPNLSHLDISHDRELGGPIVTDNGLKQLAASCPKLCSLVLWNCEHIGGWGRGGGVTDAGIAVVFATRPNLGFADIVSAAKADFSLAAFTTGHPGIHCLDLAGCGALTDAGIEQLAASCNKLTCLNLGQDCSLRHYDHDGVTDSWIERIAKGCPSLTHISLAWCARVTDVGIGRLAAGCPKLTHVGLYGCRQVTATGIECLAAGCPRLRQLDLRGLMENCDSPEMAERLAAGYPHLELIQEW